jgi:predicted nucleic acid-binding protein
VSFYLDASAILPILIAEPGSPAIDAFIAAVDADLAISDFAAAEVASALSRLVRIQKLDLADALIRLADFDSWRIQATATLDVAATDIRLAHVFVRRFDLMLRAPDALHAAICRRTGAVLVTLDRRLARAASELGVAVTIPAV